MSKCDLEHYVAQMILDPLAAILEAIRGPKYEDTEDYYNGQVLKAKWASEDLENDIFNMMVSPNLIFQKNIGRPSQQKNLLNTLQPINLM